MNLKDELVNAIMENFKVADNIFIKAQIETALDNVPQDQYSNFFNQLCGGDDEFKFKGALDRVEIVSKRFKDKIEQPLIEAVKSEAQAISDSLYKVSNACHNLIQRKRDRYPNDKSFFDNVELETLYDPATLTDALSKTDIYVINSLGRDWFMNIAMAENESVNIKKIEKVLAKKDEPQNQIAANVRKMIKQ